MGLTRARRGAPRRLMLSFILLLLLPAMAVVWLGVQLLRQDRDLEIRQRQERREVAVERVAAAVAQALAATERRLAGPPASAGIEPDDDAVLLTIRDGALEAWPRGRLLYHPQPPAAPPPAAVFEEGEAFEYRFDDPAAAVRTFRRLASSPDANIRAGALMRLARNLRRAGRVDEALLAYEQLASVTQAYVIDLPADLVARRARCALLHDAGRSAELRAEAAALLQDLTAARWTVDRGTFDAYVAEIHGWLGRSSAVASERRAVAAAAEWLWRQQERGALPATGRRALRFEDVGVTIVWQSSDGSLVALAAGPRLQQRAWFQAVPAAQTRGFTVSLADDEGRVVHGKGPADAAAVVRRKPSETGLPWTLLVADAGPDGGSDEFARRRRTLLAGLSFVLLLVIAGGYSVARAVSHEFAVARLQTDFVAAVSHEFRTPLTSLHQFTALLSDEDEPPPDKRRMFYQALTRASERLRRLVESLLDFGRMEAGARPYRLEPLDLGALVRGVAADFERDVEAQGYTIGCVTPPGALVVDADADALTRAIWNLLDNAVKYSGASRRIDVHAANGRRTVTLSVRDEGIGIPRHEQREIFEKFVRGEASRAHGIKGTGIGLAMVRHIVEAHGGRVDVQSAPGAGSTFTIVLPLRSTE